MAHRQLYSPTEWETLQLGFIVGFFGVAAADGNIDKKEVAAFAREIAQGRLYKNDLVREVLTSVQDNLTGLLDRFKGSQKNIVAYFTDVADALDKHATPTDAETFKRSLLSIVAGVAKASGGFMGMGNMVSKDENAALAGIAISLRLKLT